MEGDMGDVKLDVTPSNYWQVNAYNVGFAHAAISEGEPGRTILGLPLMIGYFTIFDGEADGGKGVIKFATKVSIEPPECSADEDMTNLEVCIFCLLCLLWMGQSSR